MREVTIGCYEIRTGRWCVTVDGVDHWFEAGPPWDGKIVRIGDALIRVRLGRR